MINFIKKIFSIFEEHPDKKRKSSRGIVGTQSTSWSQSCKCEIKRKKELEHNKLNNANNKSYLGNQTVEFVKIANKARNQKNNKQ